MTRTDAAARGPRSPLRLRRHPPPWHCQHPTWHDASPALIAGALRRAVARPTGNWYVLGASRQLHSDRPFGTTIAGLEVVAWRGADGRVHAGPGNCPHLGAPLRQAAVRCGRLVCHWHGLAFDGASFASWEPYPAYDDGVLLWVRLDAVGGERPSHRPFVPDRPDPRTAVAAVLTAEGCCEPEDIVANRLDPWHGAWFHPYAFTDLTVEEAAGGGAESDTLVVRVSFRLTRHLVVPVRAAFTAPGPRTVVMCITEGEGQTSVVETHATPRVADPDGRPRTAVIEATIATSPRPGFQFARRAAPLLRPVMRAVAGRLWRDDLAYAERRWQLRSTGRFPG